MRRRSDLVLPGTLFVNRLRAPATDGSLLVEPPAERAAELLERSSRFHLQCSFLGMGHAELRALVRRELLDDGRGPWFVAGHQPELFHPGVWVKNYVLARLANGHAGTALNLVVDNDTLKSSAVRVPVWPADAAHVRGVPAPFDSGDSEVPYEEARVRDEAIWRSFPDRVAALTERWPYRPFVADFWKRTSGSSSPLIGERFAAARRDVERAWGVRNEERNLSVLCRTRSFAHFAGGMLSDLPRVHAEYNAAARRFRRARGIRSANHPVPDLHSDGDWLEAPFWVWRSDAPTRGRLFVRRGGDRLELRRDAEAMPALPTDRLADEWPSLEEAGWKVRTRALTTTLFARLFVADVFIHGIGGAVYDELTDAIAEAVYGRAPPGFMVVSGTLRLPLPRFPIDVAERGHRLHAERDAVWNPQRTLAGLPAAAGLIAERERWIARQPTSRRDRRERYRALRENLGMLQQLSPAGPSRRAEWDAELRANDVLGSREYSFVLQPEERLRGFLSGPATS